MQLWPRGEMTRTAIRSLFAGLRITGARATARTEGSGGRTRPQTRIQRQLIASNHLYVDIGVALATKPKQWVTRIRCECGALLDLFTIDEYPNLPPCGLCPGCNREHRRATQKFDP